MLRGKVKFRFIDRFGSFLTFRKLPCHFYVKFLGSMEEPGFEKLLCVIGFDLFAEKCVFAESQIFEFLTVF